MFITIERFIMKKILLILLFVFFSFTNINLVKAKCSFNCPKFVKNESLILWDKSSNETKWCTPNISPSVQKYSSIVKRYKYPYPENGFETFLIENAYTISNGEYEIIEAEIIETSELINKELKNSNLPDEIRIGAILREKKVIIPRSDFIFQKDDRVVFLAKKDSISIVENIFRLS